MKHKIYSVHDAKAEAYMQPFLIPNEAMAIRACENLVNTLDHQFSTNPEDYVLFGLGEFDDQTGLLEPDSPHPITPLIALRKADK